MDTNATHPSSSSTTTLTPLTTLTTLTPLTADDPRRHFATAVATAGRVIAATEPQQLGLPTPCDEFDVQALLSHLVAVLGRVAAVGRGEPAMSVPQAVTGVADDGWSAAWSDAAHGVQAVWADDALLAGTFVLPWATKSGPELLLTYTSEVSVHTWDLAKATGQEPEWDEPTLEAAYVTMLAALPAEHRRQGFDAMREQLPPHMRTMGAPFDEARPVVSDAPLIDRLVAWNGRSPEWRH
jgi:uncharacterized protein (TIGR03086 family)